jgi:ABC-2 type transport system permease protein
MTAPFRSLVRHLVLATFAPAGRGARGGETRGRTSSKRIAKTIGLGLLIFLAVGQVVGLYAYMSYASFDALKTAGLQALSLLNAAISATMLAFVLVFLTALSTYCSSKADIGMLALPIKGRELLGAKMAMAYLVDAPLSILIFAIAATIYAAKEGPGLPFYLGAVLSALALPLPPIAAVYLVIVPLVSAARPLRNKNVVMVMGGVLAIALSLGLNYYFQTVMPRMTDPSYVIKDFAGPEAWLSKLGAAYPPALVATRSMTASGARGPLLGLALLGMGLGAAALIALALGPAYARSLLGFDEQRVRRVAVSRSYVSRAFRGRGALASLFRREWRLMNREPSYFLNGPLVIILMPLILGVGVLVTKQRPDAMRDLGPLLAGWRDRPWPMLLAAAFGAFLGSSTSITCTSLSRDAKALRYLKALPIRPLDFMLAKFLHGLAFAGLGSLVGSGLCSVLLGLGAMRAAGAVLIALAFSAFACVAGLWLDTANPKLTWDTPIAAMKQNPNSIVLIFGAMALVGGLGVASAFMGLGAAGFFALYFGSFSAACAAALAAYPAFARRRLDEIEI